MGTTEDTKGLLRIIHKNHFDHRQMQCICLKEEECVYSHRSYHSPPPQTRSIVHWYNMSCKLHSSTSLSQARQSYPLLYCRPSHAVLCLKPEDRLLGPGLNAVVSSCRRPPWSCQGCSGSVTAQALITEHFSQLRGPGPWKIQDKEVFREGNKAWNAHL